MLKHLRRHRRTEAEIAECEASILAELQDDHPQSVRHCFYRLTNPRLPGHVPKTAAGYVAVQRSVLKMRRDGRVPWGWVTDATRRGYHVATYEDGADFLRNMTGLYRHDLWADVRERVEVWCESRSIAGVIEGECRKLAVSLYPTAGFSSATLIAQAAAEIRAHELPTVVYYIGDYDPAGVLIDQSIEAGLREHLDGGPNLDFVRLGDQRRANRRVRPTDKAAQGYRAPEP